MGVIIGSTRAGSAPCVEADTSPTIKVGKPYLNVSTAAGYTGREQFVDVGFVRDISVIRTFYCRKADIAEAISYLASLSGHAATFNVGGTGPDVATYSGEFILDGEIEAQSHSPSLSKLTARYIAQVMDANYAYPACIAVVRKSATKTALMVDGVEAIEWESTTAGDGTGFTIRAGKTQYATDIVAEDPALGASLQIVGVTTDADLYDTPANLAARLGEYQPVRLYRRIDLANNGEIISTTYAPRGYGNKTAVLRPLYYGWEAGVTPSLTGPVLDPREPSAALNRYAVGFTSRQWYVGGSNQMIHYTLPTYLSAQNVAAYVPLQRDEWNAGEPYQPTVDYTINTAPEILNELETLPVPYGWNSRYNTTVLAGGGIYKQWALVGYVWYIESIPIWRPRPWGQSRGTPLWIRWETSDEKVTLKAGEWDIADTDDENAVTLLEFER